MALPKIPPAQVRAHPNGTTGHADALVESYRRLAEVFHHVLSEQNLDTLLDRIADTLAELIPYDALHIYEADISRRELIPVFARSDWENEIMRTRPAFGQGITGWAVDKREPVLANDAHLDSRVAFIPGTPAEPEALISIPLLARGALKGALNVYRVGDSASFADDEFELAKWFGDAAAVALDNAQVRARLEHQAQTDSLTGLYNHRNFHERLRAELTRATRARDAVALLMFDIDEFKRVNDICGHGVGDEILVALSEMTSSLVRTSDVVCRVGGEEFAVILPSCDAGDALGLARRLMERLEARPVDAAGEITISVGIAQGPANAGNSRELVACAESAMMAAKARGKSRIVVYSPETAERPDHDPSRDVRSMAHLKMLQSVAGRLNRLNNTREIAEAIVSELRGLIDYHSCRVYLVEGDEVVPVAVKGDGVTEEQQVQALRIKLGVGVTGHVAATGKSVLSANALDLDFAIEIPGTETVDESVIAVALRYGSNVTGVVFLSKLGVGQFDESDLRLLEVLAGYAAVSLENARLYESLRREADHAKVWLDFADAISDARSSERIAAETVGATARLLECELAYLWLEEQRDGDFACVTAHGGEDDPTAEAFTRYRLPPLEAETLMAMTAAPRLVAANELSRLFRQTDLRALGPLAIASLPSGHGVRGWLAVGRPAALSGGFDGERLRLLEGLSYRTAMALQKEQLAREQQESLQVADALLGYARALARIEPGDDLETAVVRQAAEILGTPDVSLWLQAEFGGELAPMAISTEDPEHRRALREMRFPAFVAEPFADARESVVLKPEQYAEIPGAGEVGQGGDVAVAAFALDGGRMGFLVAGAPGGGTFDKLQLKLLTGFADQAKLAVSGTR